MKKIIDSINGEPYAQDSQTKTTTVLIFVGGVFLTFLIIHLWR